MSEIDEILGTNDKTYSYKTNNQNEWKEQQKNDRNYIYDTINKMSKTIGNNPAKFQEYLNIQSKFTKYSVGNCLAILEQAPKSTQIKDEESWNEKGIKLLDNAIAIKILEPSKNGDKTYYK